MPNPAMTPKRPEWYVQTGSMFENPYGVPHDQIVQMILENPAEVTAQTVFGKYVESSGLVFTGELIQQMIQRSQQRVIGDRWHDEEAYAQAKQYQAWARDHRGRDSRAKMYATGVDLARQTDYTVISVLDIRTRPANLIAWRRLNRVPWETIYREIGRTAAVYGTNVLADRTGMGGDVVLDALESRYFCPKHDRTFLTEGVCPLRWTKGEACHESDWVRLACVEGYEFGGGTGQRKKNLIEHLRNTMSVGYVSESDQPFGWLRTPPIVQLEEELSFYVWDDKGLETDSVMSLALAAWAGLEDVPGAISGESPWGG